ncbi:hypothetical protein ASD25_07500 [Brevundimonas sp. Root1423]|nr:hypothetical protein ASD25_07500 [Brevundimonas sp. Root1423]
MQVGFAFTNYNNSDLSEALVKSVTPLLNDGRARVVFVDNASRPAEVEKMRRIEQTYPGVSVIYNPENSGYFKGLNIGIRALRTGDDVPELVVVGNNDLEFPADFARQLERAENVMQRFPVVCPDLVGLDGEHQNPHVSRPITPLRRLVWRLYFSNYLLAQVIAAASRVSRRLTQRTDHHLHQEAGPIIEGYGACYVLTPMFFRSYSELWAPTFLMGEEFFLAKQIEQIGQQIYYEPSIVVQHLDHATTGEVPSRKMWEISRESHRVYREYLERYG